LLGDWEGWPDKVRNYVLSPPDFPRAPRPLAVPFMEKEEDDADAREGAREVARMKLRAKLSRAPFAMGLSTDPVCKKAVLGRRIVSEQWRSVLLLLACHVRHGSGKVLLRRHRRRLQPPQRLAGFHFFEWGGVHLDRTALSADSQAP